MTSLVIIWIALPERAYENKRKRYTENPVGAHQGHHLGEHELVEGLMRAIIWIIVITPTVMVSLWLVRALCFAV